MESRQFEIPGYRVIRQMRESADTVLLRAVRTADHQSVLLKVLKPSHATPIRSSRFRHEYEAMRNAQGANIIRALGLASVEDTLALIVEDFGGLPLSEWMATWQHAGTEALPISRFLTLAMGIVDGLSAIHAADVIHRNLSPSTIALNAKGEVKISDFEIAMTRSHEFPALEGPAVLEGALPYVSPEQTGRMNRTVDYRTDFYSLGVTFYEVLTGRLPFEATDAMELVHAHLARTPASPRSLNPAVPEALSEIVLKLMAKAPEDRYQSARGLRQDLITCLQRWQAHGNVPRFELAREDRAEHFLIPEKLYGRAAEVATILAAFERAAEGRAEIALVVGPPGIGKTAVVREVHEPIARRHGFFIHGKFDQLTRDIPLSAFAGALRDLMRQLLTAGEAQQRRWRNAVQEALGNSGQVLQDVIPELGWIIGPQPPAPPLSGTAARDRFRLLFQRLIGVFATPEHPLVIFLDDLQWADPASLALVGALVGTGGVNHLLLIGAYRDSEVGPAHPVSVAKEEIAQSGAAVTSVTLAALGSSDVNLLIADALGCAPASAVTLTELVYRVTEGNPFYGNQLLKSLYEEGLIRFSDEAGSWQCDLAQVGTLALTEDVVEFLGRRLQKLPAATQEVVRLAACIGSSFDLETLAIVCQRPTVAVSVDLWPALAVGLVVPQSTGLALSRTAPDTSYGADAAAQVPAYRFLHDRVQHAAYSLIPEEQRQATHLQIARLLLAQGGTAGRVFEIVNHFNRGLLLLADPAERQELARLNLEAGQKAKAATAFQAAWDYLTVARRLLPEDCWQNRYEFTLNLYDSSVEAAYLSGRFEAMEELASQVLEHARTLLDQLKVFEVRSQALAAQTKFLEAVNAGLDVLELLGTTIPRNPTQADVEEALTRTQAAYGGQRIADLLDLPLMTDPTQLAVMRVLASILPAAFLCLPDLYTMIVLKHVDVSIAHGNTPAAAFGYASYGLILCGKVGDIDSGYEFGQLALDLVRRLDAREWHCKVTAVVHSFIVHWKRSVRDTLGPLRAAYQSGLEVGDFQFAGYSAVLHCAFSYLTGIEKELPELQSVTLALADSIAQIRQTTVRHYFDMLLQALHDLREGRGPSKYLSGEYYDEESMLPLHRDASDWMALFYLNLHKLILDYLAGDYEQAVRDASEVEKYVDGARGFPYPVVYHLFDSLARLAAHRENPVASPDALAEKIEANQRMLKAWAAHAPVNALYKYHLVEAERLRTFGERERAIAEYDRAIEGARENHYLRDAAIAHELAGAFFLDWGKEKIARAYIEEARDAFVRWGAATKARWLADKYPGLLPGVSVPDARAQVGAGASRDHGAAAPSAAGVSLDLATVVKASQAVSGEIDLARLLAQLMRIALENAGAQRGALLLERDGGWVIEAEGDVDDGGGVSVLQGCDVRASDAVSAEMVFHVARTRTSVVLDDASGAGPFARDPHIARRGVKSVICSPLVNQGRVSGIVYLENNRATHAFTAERLELLNLLSAQMALSLDNARLYQKAQQEIDERKQAEQALRASERRFRTIFDSVNEGIFVHDLETGAILDVNRTACEMYRATREELLQCRIEDLSSREPPFTHQDALVWMKMASEDEPQLFEWMARNREGSVFWVEANLRRAVLDGRDRLLVVVRDVTERKRAEEALRQFKTIFDTANFGVVITDLSGIVTYANECFAAAHGYQIIEVLGQHLSALHGEDQRDQVDRLLRQLATDGRCSPQEILHARRDGATFPMLVTGIAVKDANGAPQCFTATMIDLAERKALEGQLQQAQKMESVGRLAGGVAHDFNNMLNVILGHTELALSSIGPDQALHADLSAIHQAAERSADLTRQLLAFARKQTVAPRVLNLNDTVGGMLKILHRLIGENIRLDWHPKPELWRVRVDPSQIDQILANLCVNARDAIADVGRIDIAVDNVSFGNEYCAAHPGFTPGDYVRLSVSDDGCGMDRETLAHVFEPFFTTKQVGGGTGLGLATVYGAVKQNNGFVNAYSEPGSGSTFTVYLPRYVGKVRRSRAKGSPGELGLGFETILLVEDEPAILNIGKVMLERLGYRVLPAATPGEAIQLAREYADEIHLLLTDVVMPEMNGRDLAKNLLSLYPRMKRLFTSGYTANVIAHHGVLDEGVCFIQKPFSMKELATKVREALGTGEEV